MEKIVTTFIYPPIPQRQFDWLAMFEDDEGDSPRKGFGATKQAAIADLLDQWGESSQCPRCAAPPVGKAAQWPDCKCYPTTE